MARRRFYVPGDCIRDDIVHLPADQAHHLRNVLRMNTGDVVEIFDGKGSGYIGEVVLGQHEVSVRNLRALSPELLPTSLVLAAALIKAAKFEWILQKATELGISAIVPLKTRWGDIQIPGNRIAPLWERWNRIVREASKQCGRLTAPQIFKPLDFSDFLVHEEFCSYTRLLFYEKAVELWRPDRDALSDRVVLCIGPEGGWDNIEIEQARKAGCAIFSLGKWTLRAETAAIAAVSIVQYQQLLLHAPSENSGN